MLNLFTGKFVEILWVGLTLAAAGLLTGCVQGGAVLPVAEQTDEPGFKLPTKQPTAQPSPVNTRVLPADSLTPAPTATITPIPDETLGLVVEVIDGDTIAVVMDGDPMRVAYEVRYIGIDAPPNSPDEPWGRVAYETNRKLANLKVVQLVRDETDFDADGYLLRYVYVDDQLLNTQLIEQGLARVVIQAPNTRMEELFRDAESLARQQRRGIWGLAPPTPTPGRQPASSATEEPALTPQQPDTSITGTIQITGTATITATVQTTITITATPTRSATTTPQPTEEPTQEPTDEATPSSDNLRGQ